MLTHRLYYHDSYQQSFEAQAVFVKENGLHAILDQSAFYPTSGGQSHDTGTLNGIPVVDVRDEGDQLIHVLSSPLEPGPVLGRIDWARRQDHMQQHSGQHLLSAVAAEEFGLQTLSVHLGSGAGSGACTIDLEGRLPPGDWLPALERRANEQVLSNRPFSVSFEDAASATGLRKPSERGGMLRIVSIEGLDRSACGGTHVRQSAEIGALLIGRSEKVRQALRIEFRCGLRVIEEARRRAQALEDLQSRLTESEKLTRKVQLDNAAFEGKELYRATLPAENSLRIWQSSAGDFDEALRAKVSAFIQGPGAIVILLAPAKKSILYAASADLGRNCGKQLQALLGEVGGKGGGGPQMAQGNVPDLALLDFISDALQR